MLQWPIFFQPPEILKKLPFSWDRIMKQVGGPGCVKHTKGWTAVYLHGHVQPQEPWCASTAWQQNLSLPSTALSAVPKKLQKLQCQTNLGWDQSIHLHNVCDGHNTWENNWIWYSGMESICCLISHFNLSWQKILPWQIRTRENKWIPLNTTAKFPCYLYLSLFFQYFRFMCQDVRVHFSHALITRALPSWLPVRKYRWTHKTEARCSKISTFLNKRCTKFSDLLLYIQSSKPGIKNSDF